MPTIGELGKTLVDNIGAVLRGGPDQPLPDHAFLTWCRPGIPFTPHDLDFAENGVFSAATAEGQKALSNHAFAFSTLMDHIPEVGVAYDHAKQEAAFALQGGIRLSEMYEQILKFSKVVHHDLTDDEKARIERCRALLQSTVKTQDLMSGQTVDKAVPSPQAQAYDARFAEWIMAKTLRGTKLAAARAATGAAGLPAVSDWETNHETYDMQVSLAQQRWAAEGFRNEVEQARAIIDQTTLRDLVLWKAALLDRFGKGRLAHVDSGTDFPYTTLVPGNIATAPGWTIYEQTHEYHSIASHEESTSWNVGGNASYGLWSIGADVNSQSSERSADQHCESFTLSVELAQAVVVRPWFYPEFFVSHGWLLRKGEGWTFDEVLSDGATPPKGLFIGFPTQVVLARNLRITSNEFASAYRETASSVGVSGSVGWGPFRVHGGYQHDQHDTKQTGTVDGATISSEGMQIIGFINHALGKAPDPLPDIPAADFV